MSETVSLPTSAQVGNILTTNQSISTNVGNIAASVGGIATQVGGIGPSVDALAPILREQNRILEAMAVAEEAYVTLVVTLETRDGATVTGQTVSLYEGMDAATGTLRETKPYHGESIYFNVPKGMRYFIVASDTFTTRQDGIYDHFAPTTASGTALIGAEIELEYRDAENIESLTEFAICEDAIKAQYATDEERIAAGRALLVGVELPDTWIKDDGVSSVSDPWIVADFCEHEGEDGQTFLGATLMRKWATANTIPFDMRNQEVATEATAQEGVYYYGMKVADYDATKTYAAGQYVFAGSENNLKNLWRCDAQASANTMDASVFTSTAAYDTSSSGYAVGDYAIKDYTLYRCTAAVDQGEAWSAKKWTDLWANPGRVGAKIAQYSASATYQPRTIVAYDDGHGNRLWRVKGTAAATEAGEAPTYGDSSKWELVAFDMLDGSAVLEYPAYQTGAEIGYGDYLVVFKTSLDVTAKDKIRGVIRYGHNNYRDSAYRQYLNSAGGKGEWWEQRHVGQIAPTALYTARGYKAGCSSELLGLVKKTKVKTWPNYITDGPNNAGTAYSTLDEFWLPSGTQMCGDVSRDDGGNAVEGHAFPYMVRYIVEALEDAGVTVMDYDPGVQSVANVVYVNRTTGIFYLSNGSGGYSASITNNDKDNSVTDGEINASRVRRYVTNHSSAAACRLRSANRGFAYFAWSIVTTGYLYSYHACSAYAGVPACVI